MRLRLEGTSDVSIPVGVMKDGDIGVITQWDGLESDIGKIVQRLGDTIIVLGQDSKQQWPIVCTGRTGNYRVRILEKGEKIVIG